MADLPLFELDRVGYAQQGMEILADVSWQIRAGEHWAVLGPNGSGKSTLLKIATGYLWPTSGVVRRLGEELLDLGELRRSIGWISNDVVGLIPPDETGIETVISGKFGQFGLRRLPVSTPTAEEWALADKQLVDLGCESLSRKRFGIMSQGERQQLLVARARMAGPLLLVLDEPCAGMDPGVRERFLGWLDERLQTTPSPVVVLVTHHMEEVMPGLKQTLVLREGRIHCQGPTAEVLTQSTIEQVYQTKLERIERSGGRNWPIWGSADDA
ncbi:MAG: ATP-binding cassette domain-containing protein [Pirellulales bacterium]